MVFGPQLAKKLWRSSCKSRSKPWADWRLLAKESSRLFLPQVRTHSHPTRLPQQHATIPAAFAREHKYRWLNPSPKARSSFDFGYPPLLNALIFQLELHLRSSRLGAAV